MNKSVYELAIDFSGAYLNLAIREYNSKNIIVNISKLIQRRESATIAEILLEILQSEDINISDISHYTVGAGPGNFTGMRIAASLISGITFGKEDILSRCLPSAYAIAKSANLANDERAAIIFDGRNKEIILFEVINKSGIIEATGFEDILNREKSEEFFIENRFDKVVALGYDLPAIKLIIPTNIIENDSFVMVDKVNAEFLLDENLGKFDNDLTNLHYIRPSVTK